MTLEEGVSVGGFGAMVLHLLSSRGALDDGRVRVRTLTLPDSYQDHDTPERMYARPASTPVDRQGRRGDPPAREAKAATASNVVQRRAPPALRREFGPRPADAAGRRYLMTAQAMRAPALRSAA